MPAELTRQQRDALKPEDFAVPQQRKLPIRNTPDDKAHVRMAYNMVERTSGLSEGERADARGRIVSRAGELGLDTRDWRTIKALALEVDAMSLEVPEVENHPNRAPFRGVLTYLDSPSNKPPGGANGKLVVMTRAAAEKALPSLLGMGVDLTENLDGHDAQKKIGLITGAEIEGDAIVIEGFLYEADFPEEVKRIQASKSRLGWSYEIQRVLVEDMSADPLVITDFVFTGAAILRKDKAAYSETSLSAQADEDLKMTKEELQAMLDAALAPMKGLQAGLDELKKDVTAMKAGGGRIDAASVLALVKPHSDSLRSCASSMQASGIGTHHTEGHVLVLNRMADRMDAEAQLGRMPHIYRDHDYFMNAARAAADVAGGDKAVKAVEEKVEAFGKKIDDIAGQVKTALSDAKAAADRMEAASKPGAERKSIPAHIQHLLSKGGITLEAAQGMDVYALDAALDKAGIKRQDAIKIKLALHHTGSFQAAGATAQ